MRRWLSNKILHKETSKRIDLKLTGKVFTRENPDWKIHTVDNQIGRFDMTRLLFIFDLSTFLSYSILTQLNIHVSVKHRKKITKSYGWIRGEKLQSFTGLRWNFSFSPWIHEKIHRIFFLLSLILGVSTFSNKTGKYYTNVTITMTSALIYVNH